MVTGHPESSIKNLSFNNIQFYIDEKQDFSNAKKQRGNKKYPKLTTSIDLASRPEHFVFAYIDGLRLKNISNSELGLDENKPLKSYSERVNYQE